MWFREEQLASRPHHALIGRAWLAVPSCRIYTRGYPSSSSRLEESCTSRPWTATTRVMWSIPFSRILWLGLRSDGSSTVVQVGGALGLFLVVLGAMWLRILLWGRTSYGTMETAVVLFLVGGGVLCSVAYRSAYRMGGGGQWHAVGCRVLRRANTPPKWRVEDTSYVGGFTTVDGEGGLNKKM